MGERSAKVTDSGGVRDASGSPPRSCAPQPRALALQRAAGNRAVASLSQRMTQQRLQRKPGNIRWGTFAAWIAGVGDSTIRVVPWKSPDGENNNYLDIE